MRIIPSLTLAVLLAALSPAIADDFTAMTAPYPPYSISKGLTVKGTSISALNAIMKQCGYTLSDRAFKLTPWAYAYECAARTPKRIVINAWRNNINEPLYKWVGPVTNSRIVLFGRKKDELSIPRKSDLKKYRIATVRWSRPEKVLLDDGFSCSDLLRTATHVNSLRMLGRGEVDLFATDERNAPALFKGLGMDPADYVICYVFKEEPLYFAFSRDTDDRLIAPAEQGAHGFQDRGRQQSEPLGAAQPITPPPRKQKPDAPDDATGLKVVQKGNGAIRPRIISYSLSGDQFGSRYLSGL